MEDLDKRINELKERVNELNYHYYTLDEPILADVEYDKLYDELVRLEKERGYSDPDSPTNRVGGVILDKFESHRHLAPLYSLGKAQTIGQIDEWIGRNKRLLEASGFTDPIDYIMEYKFDGLTINLTYDGGRLVGAATRGNGLVGEEILEQVRTIKSIPWTIDYQGLMEVQGEGVMPLSSLASYNERAKTPLKNARNAAAGALRNLDTKETEARKLDAYFYSIGYIENPPYTSQEDMLDFLRDNHFKVASYEAKEEDLRGIHKQIDYVEEKRKQIDVLTDGIVIKINSMRARDLLGHTQKAPRWALAYKFEAEEFTTILKDVIWGIGRTGRLTPSAVVEPVEIAGATVRRATLNNYDDIKRKNLSINDRVLIRRSNEVIPEILGSVEKTDKSRPIEKPKYCPACQTELIEDGPNIFCPNSISCRPQLLAGIDHFASRNAMDIDGLSEKTIDKLIEDLDLSAASQLYDLTKDDLMDLEGFKDKKSQNLLDSIEKSKEVSLSSFIYALGIKNVGTKTAEDLAREYKSLDNLSKARLDDLVEVSDIGPVIAQNIYEYFHDSKLRKDLDELLSKGIEIYNDNVEEKDSQLKGKTIVITGSFESYTRNDLKDYFKKKGVKVTSSVSSNTDYLLVGENPGSKLDKARDLGTEIVEEKDLEDFMRR